jgi:hypothetical protein
MNSPGSTEDNGLIAGVAFLIGGTVALVTRHLTYKGGSVDGPLVTFIGVSFMVLGVIFLALHIRNRFRKQ